MGVEQYSTTAASNTGLFPEGMNPSSVNNSARSVQAHIKQDYIDRWWQQLGNVDGAPTITYASGNSFTVSGDVTSDYHLNRRVRAVGSSTGTIYGYITASSYSSPNTTVTVNWDSGSLQSESLTVSLGMPTVNTPFGGVYAASRIYLSSDREVFITAGADSNGRLELYQNNTLALYITDTRVIIPTGRGGLVGKTSADSGATTGIEIATDGSRITITADDSTPLVLNRLNGDGEVIEIQRDGTRQGGIGVTSGVVSVSA